MLELTQCSFRYGRKLPYVIHDFSMRVDRGEIVALTGNSGCGKTTVARIASGYLSPESGSVAYDGDDLPYQGYCPVQLLFQHPEHPVNPWWKVRRIMSETTGSLPPDDVFDVLDIDRAWLDRYPHELSGGELQRVAISRIFVPSTRYIIADEMTSMLDAVTQARIWSAILSFARSNDAGIIAISHDAHLLSAINARTVSLG